MDLWKFFDVSHRDHTICNPMSSAKLDELVGLLDLPAGGRLLDIACGKGELLVRAARRWGCAGIGVDLSPFFVAEARDRVASEGLAGSVEIVEANASEYEAPAESFDVAVCLGASWIWAGLPGTLRALSAWARPGGVVVMGEPFWRREPSAAYLEAARLERQSFATHTGNVETGLEQGLMLHYTLVSSDDDWDRYEGLQWRAAERYERDHADDPDAAGVVRQVRAERDAYLNGGREELGWAIYVFGKP